MLTHAPFFITVTDAAKNPIVQVPFAPHVLDVENEEHADTIIADRILRRIEEDGWVIYNRTAQYDKLRIAIDGYRDDWALGKQTTLKESVPIGCIVPRMPPPPGPPPRHPEWPTNGVWKIMLPFVLKVIWDVVKTLLNFPPGGSGPSTGGPDKMQL